MNPVDKFFQNEGINSLSPEGESYFSWQTCDCCNAKAGDRYDCVAYHPESNEILKYSVCLDCVLYSANGE